MLGLLAQHVSMPETDDAQGSGFWLVVVDQFERKGIACEEAFAKAAQIITSGQDIRNLCALKMSERGLKNGKARCKNSLRGCNRPKLCANFQPSPNLQS